MMSMAVQARGQVLNGLVTFAKVQTIQVMHVLQMIQEQLSIYFGYVLFRLFFYLTGLRRGKLDTFGNIGCSVKCKVCQSLSHF